MTGYGKDSVHPNWPNKARVAVQFVLNYEEGGENSILGLGFGEYLGFSRNLIFQLLFLLSDLRLPEIES
jgi:hypothetical protein